MVKAKLSTLTEKWIDGKTEKHLAVKTERQSVADDDPKIKQTLYMSKKACKALWHNRAETGEPMSHTVEQLILEHIGKK